MLMNPIDRPIGDQRIERILRRPENQPLAAIKLD
jgi:hypothetical protein